MRCVVTGASGFLGSRLVRELLDHGHDITVVLRPGATPERLRDLLPRVRVVRGSLSDTEQLRSSLRGYQIDAMFHLAWQGVAGDARHSLEQITKNVIGSIRIAEIACELGCKHWIGAGSQAEYGRKFEELTESLSADPETSYGTAKLATFLTTSKICELAGVKFSWVRVLSLYGPDDAPSHLLPSLIASLLRGERPAVTKGEQVWDFLHVADAAEAFRLIAETGATGLFNLGSGERTTIRETVELIRDLIDPDLSIGFGEQPYRPDQVMFLLTHAARLRSATGWKPRISLRDGLRDLVESCRRSEDLKALSKPAN